MQLKIRTPVTCPNGHKTFWYWEINQHGDIGSINNFGAAPVCTCCAQRLGKDGYIRSGNDQLFTGWKDRYTGADIYEGDIVYTDWHWTEDHITIRLL